MGTEWKRCSPAVRAAFRIDGRTSRHRCFAVGTLGKASSKTPYPIRRKFASSDPDRRPDPPCVAHRVPVNLSLYCVHNLPMLGACPTLAALLHLNVFDREEVRLGALGAGRVKYLRLWFFGNRPAHGTRPAHHSRVSTDVASLTRDAVDLAGVRKHDAP